MVIDPQEFDGELLNVNSALSPKSGPPFIFLIYGAYADVPIVLIPDGILKVAQVASFDTNSIGPTYKSKI